MLHRKSLFWLLLILFLSGIPTLVNAQLVQGLLGASGSTVGPDGAIYVTQGAIGEVTRVDPDSADMSPFTVNLPPSLVGIGGAVDVAFLGNTAYVLVAMVGTDFGGAAIDGIYRVDGYGVNTLIADIGAYSVANPPATPWDFSQGVQYALESYRGGLLVSDGHHNRILMVTKSGQISEFYQLENTVPTGMETSGSMVLVAESGAAPNAPEDGKVIAIAANSDEPYLLASGAPMMIDVEYGPRHRLYALAHGVWDGAFPGSPSLPFTGSLMEVRQDGSLDIIATNLNQPTSMEFIGNTAYIVTLGGDIVVINDIYTNSRPRCNRDY